MAVINYGQAINDGHRYLLENDERVFLMGQGVDSPWFVGNTTTGLIEEFGETRVIDPPISEAAMTGSAIGAAMVGMRPIVFHPRMDFMYLALDQIVNHCANWNYMFNGQVNVPVVIRGIVNRGGEQSTQHSQSPLSTYAHIPGIKVVAPATPRDAKGLLIAASEDNNPVIYIDDRWLYDLEEEVPEGHYTETIGKIRVAREGTDVTIVAVSYMVREALKAAKKLESEGVSVNVVDIRTIKPMDEDGIIRECEKTGRVVVACGDWECCGLAAYISSRIYERLFGRLKNPIEQIAFENIPTPASTPLETAFFKWDTDIAEGIRRVLDRQEDF